MRLALIILLAVPLASSVARADDPKEMFNHATAEFNLGHYKEAAAKYEDIYKITLEPVLLYNIAQAHRLAGNLDQALFFYKGYLRATPGAKNRVEVRNRIAEMEDAVAARKRSQERPPNAPAAGELAPSAPVEKPSPPPPPAAVQAQTEPEPAPAPQPVQSERAPVYKKWWFWTAIGGAVVVAGVVIGVSVALTQPAPSFNPNLPQEGPGPHTSHLLAVSF